MKLKARMGTNNAKRCAFCSYWTGNADNEYVGNNTYAYEQSAVGLCRANHDMRKRANDGATCKWFSGR